MKNSQLMRKSVLYIVVFIWLSISILPVYASSDKIKEEPVKRIVRVGLHDDSDTGAESELTAYQKDYLQAVAEYADWQYVYVDRPWAECLKMVRNGDLDLLMCVSKTDERLKDYDYSSESMGTELCYLYGRSDTTLQYDDYAGFEGMTVGYEAGSTIIDSLRKYGQAQGFTFRAKAYPEVGELFAALDRGEIDAAAQSNFNGTQENYVLLTQCCPDPIYIITSKKKAALKTELDNAMAKLFSYNQGFNTNLYDYHFGTIAAQRISYTKQELAYLKQKPIVNVCYETNWIPFEYDTGGNVEGITPDVLRAIGKDTGITFRFVLADSTQSVYNNVSKSSHDTVMAVSYDYVWANDHNLLVTQPYVKGDVSRVTSTSGKKVKTVATIKGGYLENQVHVKYPEYETISFPNAEACMEAVAAQKADCTFLNDYQAAYYRRMQSYENFSYQADNQITQAIALGVTRDSNPVLFDILSKSLKQISVSNLQEILNKNEMQAANFSYHHLLRYYPVQTAIVLGIFISLSGLLIVFLISSSLRKQQNIRLEAARAETEMANRAKSEFISRISHDIRTPIGAIANMTDFAFTDMNDKNKLQNDLRKIQTSNTLLLSLINDVLDISKIDSGKIELHDAPYTWKDFMFNIQSIFEPLCMEKGLKLELVSNPDLPAFMIDATRLNQIAMNILANAVKYTPQGGSVKVITSGEKTADNRYIETFQVIDTGIGMSSEFQKVMFEPFSQEYKNPGRDKVVTGSGLGLSIVNRLVKLMGGTISVNSELGRGTHIAVSFTAETVITEKEEKEEKAEESEALPEKINGQILLAEDNEINAEIETRMLESLGAEIVRAENGEEAADIFAASEPFTFACILMDIQMPVMDGYEATVKIRELHRSDAKEIPIIAMTADAFSAAMERSRKAGMNDYITKPLNLKILHDVLIKHINDKS